MYRNTKSPSSSSHERQTKAEAGGIPPQGKKENCHINQKIKG